MPLELIGLEWQFVRERFILALGGWFNSGSKIGDELLIQVLYHSFGSGRAVDQ